MAKGKDDESCRELCRVHPLGTKELLQTRKSENDAKRQLPSAQQRLMLLQTAEGLNRHEGLLGQTHLGLLAIHNAFVVVLSHAKSRLAKAHMMRSPSFIIQMVLSKESTALSASSC